jgi:hypothetical protein
MGKGIGYRTVGLAKAAIAFGRESHGAVVMVKLECGKTSNGSRKFTADQVRAIRSSMKSNRELAAEYQVTPHTIYQVRIGTNYAWVV